MAWMVFSKTGLVGVQQLICLSHKRFNKLKSFDFDLFCVITLSAAFVKRLFYLSGDMSLVDLKGFDVALFVMLFMAFTFLAFKRKVKQNQATIYWWKRSFWTSVSLEQSWLDIQRQSIGFFYHWIAADVEDIWAEGYILAFHQIIMSKSRSRPVTDIWMQHPSHSAQREHITGSLIFSTACIGPERGGGDRGARFGVIHLCVIHACNTCLCDVGSSAL